MKEVTHIPPVSLRGVINGKILVPKEWEFTNDWDSHRPLLYLAVSNSGEKPVTEFGCGYGSTPLLQTYCRKNKKHFFSYETLKDYADKFSGVTLMQDYNQVHLSDGLYKQGVLFIDSAPAEQRKDLINKHANHAWIIVVHDTEESAEYVYGLKNILSTFKYRLDFKPEGLPATTAVSNFVNMEEWSL